MQAFHLRAPGQCICIEHVERRKEALLLILIAVVHLHLI
jgi:hypothetical protein